MQSDCVARRGAGIAGAVMGGGRPRPAAGLADGDAGAGDPPEPAAAGPEVEE